MSIIPTANKSMDVIGIGDPNWGGNVNNNTFLIDQIISNAAAIAALPGTNILTTAQIQNVCLKFTGALTANSRYNLPTGASGVFIIINATTGPWDLIIGSADGGTTVNVVQGSNNTVYISPLSGVGGAIFCNTPLVNTSSNGQIIFNSAGAFSGSSELIFTDPNFSVGSKHSTISATCSGTTATLTFLPNTKVIPIGSFISVSGITPNGYNGDYLVTFSSAGSVSYTVATSGLSPQTVPGFLQYGSISYGGDQIAVSATDLNKINAKLDQSNIATQTDIDAKTAGKLIPANLYNTNFLTSAVAIPATSGTTIQFTGIPSWAKKITFSYSDLSTNGASSPIIQIGDGSYEITGYLGATFAGISGSTTTSSSNFVGGVGFQIGPANTQAAENKRNALFTLALIGNNTWALSGASGDSVGYNVSIVAGSKALAGVLDRIRLTTINGTDIFDSGLVNIMWE